MVGLIRKANGALNIPAYVSITLVTAILAAIGAAVAVLLGYPVIGGAAIAAALLAGVMAYINGTNAPSIGTIAVKTVLVFVFLAVLVGLETVLGHTSYTVPTILAGVSAAVVYFQQEIAAYVNGTPQPTPSA